MRLVRLASSLLLAFGGCLDLSHAPDSGFGGGLGFGGGFGGGFIAVGGGTAATGGGTAATGGGTAATGGGTAASGGGTAATGGGTAATGGGTAATDGGTAATGGGTAATGGGTAATGGGAATCAPACPVGFTCNSQGQCQGDQASLTLDVQSVALTTKLKVNGALPQTTCASSTTDAVGTVSYFASNDDLATYSDTFTCAETTFSHTVWVAPGDAWQLQVARGNLAANLPSGTFDAGVVQLSTAATVTIDVPSVELTGAITANLASVTCLSNIQIGGIGFRSTAGAFTGALMCVAGQGASFSLKVPPGSYDVYAWAYDAQTMLAQVPYLLASGQAITASTSLTFNETTWAVTLPVTLNGATPSDDCATNPQGFAKLEYSFEAGGFRPIQRSLSCTQLDNTIAARVGPGDFHVVVSSSRPNLPNDPVAVPVSTSGAGTYPVDLVAYQVAGTITLNGAPLTGCDSAWAVVLSQNSNDLFNGKFFELPITCGATTTFKGWAPAGDYTLMFNGTNPMPNGWPASADYSRPFKVSGNSFNTALDLKTTSITLKPLANGALPLFSACTATSPSKLSVWLASPPGSDPATSALASVPCASTATQVTTTLFTGTYAISLAASASNLPQVYTSPSQVTLSAPVTVTVDAPSRRVAGFLTVNASSLPNCTPGARLAYLAFRPNSQSSALVDLTCDGRGVLAFDTWLAPGEYDVSVGGAGTALPLGRHLLVKRLLVQ